MGEPEVNVSRWEEYLEHKTGVFLSARSGHVGTAVRRRMKANGVDDETSYWRMMSGPGANLECSMLIDELVVTDTRFFRHRPSYEFLRSHLLQGLANDSIPHNYAMWSLGCSSGEEAWSLAMVASDCFSQVPERDYYFAVQGTDVSLKAVSLARLGEYSSQQLSLMAPDEKQRYLEPSGRKFRVVDSLRSRVAFSVGNIIELSNDGMKYDVVYCQNMLVYFRKWRRRRVLDLMVSRLNPGGLLIIGPGEMTQWNHPQLEFVGKGEVVAYQKK